MRSSAPLDGKGRPVAYLIEPGVERVPSRVKDSVPPSWSTAVLPMRLPLAPSNRPVPPVTVISSTTDTVVGLV